MPPTQPGHVDIFGGWRGFPNFSFLIPHSESNRLSDLDGAATFFPPPEVVLP
jgi:hypothetical protein